MFKIWGSTYQPNLASQVQISGSMMDLLNLGPVTKLRMSSWLYGGLLVRPNSLQTRTHKSLGLDFNSKVVFNNIVNTNLCVLFFLCLWFPTPIFVGPGTSSQRACNLLLLTAKGDRADGHFWVYLFSGWSFWGMRVFENPSENLYVARMVFLFKVRCKTHYNFHVADDIKATRLNPAMFQNFDEESFLGKLKHIGIRCHGATCVQRMFMRYLLCLAMFVREFSKKANHME